MQFNMRKMYFAANLAKIYNIAVALPEKFFNANAQIRRTPPTTINPFASH